MRKITIPKKSGGQRTIYVQDPVRKHIYRNLGYEMSEFHNKHGTDVVHGFVDGRSPVSNASCHVNKKFTLTVDLKDFFDTVTPTLLVKAGIDPVKAKNVCIDGATRQGLSSSPASANCAAIPLDKEILKILPPDTIYTRYADDLTFSSDNIKDLLELRDKLPRIIENCGFKINPKKTRIQSSKFGRRIITGIAVDNNITVDNNIYPTKKQRKNLRAAGHRLNKLSNLLFLLIQTNNLLLFAVILESNRKQISRFVGLREWCKLKPPSKSLGGKCLQTAMKIRTKLALEE